jgi:hypothetical protein
MEAAISNSKINTALIIPNHHFINQYGIIAKHGSRYQELSQCSFNVNFS